MSKITRIAIFSIKDQVRHKSFYILLGICILLVLLLRGCYKGNFIINNKHVDNLTVAWHASKFAFHIIAGGMMLLTALLSVSMFTRDGQNGNMVLFLSKPIKRSEYILGRITGVWILVSVFMFILHLTIVIIAFLNTGNLLLEFFLASIICTLNLLFLILLASLFSFILPDFMAAVTVLGIAGISFISDSLYIAKHSKMIQSFMGSGIENNVSIWRIFWPKTAMLQYYASSFIDGNDLILMSPVHPLFNIFGYILLSYFLLVWIFNQKEI